jgi:hypothetical protein
MFERFTDKSRQVVVDAQTHARTMNHNYIGTEHLLLALTGTGAGLAMQALGSFGITTENVEQVVVDMVGNAGSAPSGHIPFTPRSRKVLELALRESLKLGNNYIGPEHLLLGLIAEGEGVAAQIIVKLAEVDLATVCQQLLALLPSRDAGTQPIVQLSPRDVISLTRTRKTWLELADVLLPIVRRLPPGDSIAALVEETKAVASRPAPPTLDREAAKAALNWFERESTVPDHPAYAHFQNLRQILS